MCGISGIVSYKNNQQLIKSIVPVLQEIKHRGPDDEGYVFFSEATSTPTSGPTTPPSVLNSNLAYTPKITVDEYKNSADIVLGHRKLSIIDLTEKAHQPMCDESKNYWIVYNGEIYNFQEIRSELIDLGHHFTSKSDSEVVLKAYIEWGKKCLQKFNGMWSFVVYNKKTQVLFGARDRFGVKPFYYINNKNYFAFCSEIKGLLKIANFKKEINPKAVYDYLVLNKTEIDDESFFKTIFELKPARLFELNTKSGILKIEKYYKLKFNKKWKSKKNNDTEIINNVKEKISKAINLRLNANVKIGSCLSGGVDSSIIVTEINQLLKEKEFKQIGKQQEVFTASYPNEGIDESKWAKMVVDRTKTNWNQTFPSATNLKNQLLSLVYAQDIPFSTSSTFSQFKVMELIQQKGVKVTMDGQGADELFGGYSPHYVASIINGMFSFSCSSLIDNLKVKQANFSKHSQIIKLPLQFFIIKYFPKIYLKKLIKKQVELKYIHPQLLTQHKNRFHYINDKFSASLNKLLHYQFTEYGLKYLMRTADRNSMHHSVESRTPFADDVNLIEEVFNIPGKLKIQHGKSKYLLREAMKDVLPKEIYNRTDKVGFASPEQKWLKELKPFFKEIISQQKNDEFIRWEDFYKDFDVIYENALKTNTARLWRFIVFALWKKVYEV